MHVGLDLLFLVPGASGGRETYARELLPALRAVAPELRLTAFVNRETAAEPPAFLSVADRIVVLPRVSANNRAAWALGELVGVARAARGVDVLHGTANFAPLTGRCTRVLTLHDLLFRRRPDLLSPAMRIGTEAMVPPAARRATRVITVSNASRDDIVAELRVPAGRVDVVPNGIAPPRPGDAARARARLGAGERPIVLSVATDLPHKNLRALLQAQALLDEPPLLVFAGHGTELLPGGLGAIPWAELEDLYAAASGLITPTLWEGFGLPVLESLARGVPVACSDLPVLREVGGEDVRYFDPGDPAQIAAALRELATGARRGQGRERALGFTWEAAARGTLEAYERAAR